MLMQFERLSQHVPLEVFTVVGTFLEELIAPLPSPFVLTTAGTITKAQGKALGYILFISVLAAISKTFGGWILYKITDKLEDFFTSKVGKFIGVNSGDIEKIGGYFNGTKRDGVILFIMRSLPIVPSSPISITSGLIKINMKTFIISTFLGTIIRNLCYLYLGYTGLAASEEIINGLNKSETIGEIVVIILIIVALLWGYKQRNKFFSNGENGNDKSGDNNKKGNNKIKEAKDLLSYKEVDEMPKEESDEYSTIYIFRHGQTKDNADFIFSGARESKLTKEGKKQAEVLGEKLKDVKFDRLISSPQIRAVETMKIVMSKNKLSRDLPIEIDERLRERSYGDLTGKSKMDIQLKDPEELMKIRRSYNYVPPNGESIEMVCKRVADFCDDLVRELRDKNLKVAISCHGNSIRGFRKYFEKLDDETTAKLETPLGQDYAAYVIRDQL
jgi:broad specificity phosphatase PhoE/membrane protein DedA with SNARE-associated domain